MSGLIFKQNLKTDPAWIVFLIHNSTRFFGIPARTAVYWPRRIPQAWSIHFRPPQNYFFWPPIKNFVSTPNLDWNRWRTFCSGRAGGDEIRGNSIGSRGRSGQLSTRAVVSWPCCLVNKKISRSTFWNPIGSRGPNGQVSTRAVVSWPRCLVNKEISRSTFRNSGNCLDFLKQGKF